MNTTSSIYAPVGDRVNRVHFGQMIVAIRSLEGLTRAQLATATGMGHKSLENLETGVAAGSMTHGAQVQRWMEMQGYIFPSGTARIHFDKHRSLQSFQWGDLENSEFVVDLTMPAGMRRALWEPAL